MSDFTRTLRTDQTSFFSLIPRDIVDLVAERVPRAVYEHEKRRLLEPWGQKEEIVIDTPADDEAHAEKKRKHVDDEEHRKKVASETSSSRPASSADD